MNSFIKIEDLLKKGEELVLLPVGVSMLPMLKHRKNQIIIESPKNPLMENDVVLFKRKNGQLVLHRIIRINNGEYIIRGDNCLDSEFGIQHNQIIGILKGFYKGPIYVDCDKNLIYKIYVILIRKIFYLRLLKKKIFSFNNYKEKKRNEQKERF